MNLKLLELLKLVGLCLKKTRIAKKSQAFLGRWRGRHSHGREYVTFPLAGFRPPGGSPVHGGGWHWRRDLPGGTEPSLLLGVDTRHPR
jgi:hypothetical protein